MSEVNDALADVKVEGDTDPFAPLGEKTPSDSPTEKKQEEDKPVEGTNTQVKDVPFHEHPRWIERENELKALREKEAIREQEITDLKKFKEETSQRFATTSNIPKWFSTLYGENQEAWDQYSEHDMRQREEIKGDILKAQAEERARSEQEVQYWNKWVDDEVQRLTTSGKKFDRNKLIKIMLDYRPTDEKNNFDFNKGYAIYEALELKEANPQVSQARKRLADSTTKTSAGETKGKGVTAQFLRSRNWNNIDKD